MIHVKVTNIHVMVYMLGNRLINNHNNYDTLYAHDSKHFQHFNCVNMMVPAILINIIIIIMKHILIQFYLYFLFL